MATELRPEDAENPLLTFPRRWPRLVGAIVFLIGFILYLLTSDDRSLLQKALHKLGEFVALGVALNLITNYALKNAERQVLLQELDARTAPIRVRLDLIDSYIQSIAQLTKYTGVPQAKSRWVDIAHRNTKLYLVGEVPLEFASAIRSHLLETGKTLSVFVPASEMSPKALSAFIDLATEPALAKAGVLKLYHLERLAFGFIAIGCNANDTSAEVLINYQDGDRIGIYVTQQTALSMLRAYQPRLESASGLQIASEAFAEFLRASLNKHRRDLQELREFGVPAHGKDQLCELMIQALRDTRETLCVTHIAVGNGISVMKEPAFQKWLAENYSAAKRIAIRRIFIVPPNELNNPLLLDVARQMSGHGIEVYFREIGTLTLGEIKDFSVYDGHTLIKTAELKAADPSWGGGYTLPGSEELVGHMTCDKNMVERFKALFEELLRSPDTKRFG